jgi:hypothetical protein
MRKKQARQVQKNRERGVFFSAYNSGVIIGGRELKIKLKQQPSRKR